MVFQDFGQVSGFRMAKNKETARTTENFKFYVTRNDRFG